MRVLVGGIVFILKERDYSPLAKISIRAFTRPRARNISANVAFSASDSSNRPLTSCARRIRFSSARYSFRNSNSWSTVPVMYASILAQIIYRPSSFSIFVPREPDFTRYLRLTTKMHGRNRKTCKSRPFSPFAKTRMSFLTLRVLNMAKSREPRSNSRHNEAASARREHWSRCRRAHARRSPAAGN